MAVTLASGLSAFEDHDNVSNDAMNENWQTLDDYLRPYREEVDTTTRDAEAGVYRTVRYRREDGTLYLQATLSNKVNGYYTTDTWTFYAADGQTVVKTRTWTLAYDEDGIIISKEYEDA